MDMHQAQAAVKAAKSAKPVSGPGVWWRWLRQWRRAHLQVDRAAVLEHVEDAGALRPRYGFMIVMSAGIATLGLLQNSVAVIIGAMLISPLMGPIVEMGMSLATFDFRKLRMALTTLAVGLASSLLVAVLIVAFSPLQEATPQILARTEPTLFDLLVAVFSGLAGAYATITRKGETIVGVAIATALMPPLAVVGYGIAANSPGIVGGAGFLFMTNLLAIALSVTMMARWYGFGHEDTPRQTALQATLIVGTFLVLSVPLGLALRDIAARSFVDRTVRTTLDAAARESNGRITTLRVDRDGRTLNVDAVLLTPKHRPRLELQLEQQLEREIGQPVNVQLREVLTADDAQLQAQQATLAQLRDSVEQLQSAAVRDEQARSARDRALDAVRARALEHLGRFDVLADGSVRWQLQPQAGLDIAAARRLERSLQADAAVPVQVIPALQALPPLVFDDDSTELDARLRARIADVAWALDRWQVGAVRVTGHGGNSRTALARARAVSEALGLPIEVLPEAATAEQSRELIALDGRDAVRSVRVAPKL
ncbi:DUF389 domain-containing protein [Lysobacter korlensis]|uniref:DUF389 domain-containing protein n=1 Tax=Lysobacter korlensis TaxID=553636 RepID=A0ABV6RHG8_9GAMM